MDFVQVMKDWRRMCKHYSHESMKNGQLSCVDMCPLGTNTACGMIEDALDSDIEDMAKEVAKWAAEHPEPVYPTWWSWLINEGVIEKGSTYTGAFDQLKTKSIPAASRRSWGSSRRRKNDDCIGIYAGACLRE